MTTYTWPTSNEFCLATIEWKLAPNIIRSSASPFNGHYQTTEVPGARWIARVTFPAQYDEGRAVVEAWFNRVRGAANRIAMWHPARPAPRGTLQANTTTAGTAAYGATSISITATTGLTLLAGDMISIATADSKTQLVQIVQDATAVTGAIAAAFSPPLRWSVASAAAVVVIRPTAQFFLDEAPSFPFAPGVSPGFSISLTETF